MDGSRYVVYVVFTSWQFDLLVSSRMIISLSFSVRNCDDCVFLEKKFLVFGIVAFDVAPTAINLIYVQFDTRNWINSHYARIRNNWVKLEIKFTRFREISQFFRARVIIIIFYFLSRIIV